MSSKSVHREDGGKGQVLKEEYLRKLKTMKKKYFVLRGESTEASARIEYYDSEKKYRTGQPPKRTISLKMCFNINRRTDTKQKHVIGLYTRDEVFNIVLENERQLEEWLRLLLELQTGEDLGEPRKPIFEHIWEVKLQDKGLGDSKNLVGAYYVCLSEQTLSLVRVGSEQKNVVEIPLTQIRRCGDTETFFYIEVGRQSVLGAGELWMLTTDATIAKSMNAVILKAFTMRQRDQNLDPHRKRSSSATEMNRPPGMLQRRQTHGAGTKVLFVSPYSGSTWNPAVAGFPGSVAGTYGGPVVSVSVTAPDSPYDNVAPRTNCPCNHMSMLQASRSSSSTSASVSASHRRHSVSAMSSSSATHAPVRATLPPTHPPDPGVPAGAPADGPCIISHQRTKSCPVSDTSLPLIVEPPTRVLSQTHVFPSCTPPPYPHPHPHPHPDGDRRGSGGALRRPLSLKSSTGTRERSDSMPSRNRTTSEGTHKALIRPSSVHLRGVSSSPPGPIGPASIDSAGSSLSIDETDGERVTQAATPDDQTILEENVDEALHWPNDSDLEAEKLDTYQPMRHPASLSLPIHQRKISTSSTVHGSPCGSSPVSDYLPMSPGESTRSGLGHGSSPSYNSDYLTMSPSDTSCSRRKDYMSSGTSPANAGDYISHSPAGARRFSSVTSGSPSIHSDYLIMSPSESRGRGYSASVDYLPMSPADVASVQRGTRSHGHSRESSLAEEAYVPMAPAHSDDGYVDMEPVSSSGFLHDDHRSVSPGSSCSITSGTPSSDHYMLEKVPSYFTPSEEEEGSQGRSLRTHSFGSQTKGRIDVRNAADTARVRAFSMGNQQRPVTHKLAARPNVSGKFPSAPLLSSSWSGTSRQATKEPPSDFMEMDFTKNAKYRFKNLPVENLGTQATSSADSGYMDMSSKSPPKLPTNKQIFSPPESKGVLIRKTAVISSSTLKTIGENQKPQKFPTTSSPSINILPSKHHAPEKPYMDMKPRLTSESRSEGYMDMSFGPSASVSKIIRKGSTDSMGDYLPMQGGAKRASDASADYMPMGCGKRASQPIAIASGSPMVRGSPLTPPKHPTSLPLEHASTSMGLLSSLRRNTKRKSRKKAERRGSKENVTTPTAIFPLSLNSPQSPKETAPDTDLVAPLNRVLRICSKENSPAIAESVSPDTADYGDYAIMRPGVSTTQRWAGPSASRPPPSPLLPLEAEPAPQSRDSFELSRLQAASASDACPETHPGVSRQVSTSSSSSTEVMSVKEVSVFGACSTVGAGACAGPGSTERDITYASLDLGSEGEEPRSPRPSPAPSPAPGGPFSYAEIDFQKCESLRAPAQAQPYSRQIRH